MDLDTLPADEPVPFTLTTKADELLAALDGDLWMAGEWACEACGDAYISTPPGDVLCPACRALGAMTG